MGPLTLIVRGVSGIGTGAWLIGRAGRGVWRSAWEGDPLAQRSLAQALALFIWRPLFTLIPLAALVGLITGIAAARILALYRAELVVMGALVETLLRDVQPLVVGLFVSGSVAVELSSRLGAMSLNREIDALEMLGHDPARHVLGPSLAAVLAAAPVHMLGAAVTGLLACALPLRVNANVGWPDFARIALSDAAAAALLTGMGKALLFALIAFGVGAAVGSRPVRAPADIGRRATTAFTGGLLGIFTAAAVWTAVG